MKRHPAPTRRAAPPWTGFAAALLLACCAPAQQAAAPAAPAEQASALLDRIEADVEPALMLDGVEQASATLAQRMEELGVPAVSVAVWSDGEATALRAWGTADRQGDRAATPDTLFQAASISKPVAAMGLLDLVEEGLLSLDQEVNQHLTSWQVPANPLTDKAPVTLRRLLSHTAGTTVHGFPGYPLDAAVPTVVGVLDGEGNTDPVRVDLEPGTEWRYSGGGYTIAQLLAVDLTGRPFPELLRERVLAPLGMTASTFEQPLPAARRAEAANAYRAGGDAVAGGWHVYPEMAAAGLWTTAADLARFARSIQQARAGAEHPVLAGATLEQMFEPHLGDYGIGLALYADGAFFGHGGSNEGFRGTLIAQRDGDSGVAILTNSDRGGPLTRELLFTVARELDWPEFQPPVKKVVRLPEAKRQALRGRYSTAGPPGAVEIYLENGEIFGRSEWDGQSIRLLAESETRLFDPVDGMVIDIAWEDDRPRVLTVGPYEFRRIE